MNEMNLIIDRDLSLLFNDVYSRLNLPKPSNDDQLIIDLVEWILRIPDRRPRVVHRSSKLNSKILTPYELQGVRQITKTLQTGCDLRPFLGTPLAVLEIGRNHKMTFSSLIGVYYISIWDFI